MEEEQAMKSRSKWMKAIVAAMAALAGAWLALWQPAQAQLSTAILRGHITLGQTPAKAGVSVVATNVDNGFTTRAVTREDGSYALTGLDPGNYRIEVSAEGYDQKTQVVTLHVGESADLNIAVTGTSANLEQVVVVGETIVEKKTSEVGTVITQKQIQSLPQITRNFLSFADLAPGVSFTTASDGTTRLQGGAQADTNVNVYVDGVGQKNYVLQGGITGQDSSRGNPFPQSAIKEYKVVSQNYKAEFDQVSSAAIIAVSKSGTNEFHGDAFWDHTSQAWRDATPAEVAAGKGKAESFQNQFGVSLGGPIIQDVAHIFFAYEGKRNKDPVSITLGAGATPATVPPSVAAAVGGSDAPFNEDLFFGKLDWQPSGLQRLELTAKVRQEDELTSVRDQMAVSWGTKKTNNETRVDLKDEITTDNWINEAHVTYEYAYWAPTPNTFGPGFQWQTASGASILNTGAGPAYQRKGQHGEGLQDDFTITDLQWHGSHVPKFGLKLKWVTLDAQELQPYNPQYFFDLGYSATIPYQVQFGSALNGVGNGRARSRNLQFGTYAQDDWEINRRLTVNAGLRWDYEYDPTYLHHVTPPDVASALRGWANINNPNSGFNINDYISNGTNRSTYLGQIQPRVGASYDLFADQRHVLFGGYGRAYDRDIFDYLQLEQTKGTFPSYTVDFLGDPNHPCVPSPSCVLFDPSFFSPSTLLPFVTNNGSGREVDVLNNKLKIPHSDQVSFGIRDTWGIWNTELTYSYIESRNGFVWLLGSRGPGGLFFVPNGTNAQGPPFGHPIPGFGNLILGTSGIETKTSAVFLKVDKVYTRDSGWGTTLAYTFSDAKENRQFGQQYALDFPTLKGYGWQPSSGVNAHKVVATSINDLPRGWLFSSKLTLESGAPIDAIDCSVRAVPCFNNHFFPQRQAFIFPGKIWAFREVDVALSKDFPIGWHQAKFQLRGDILNVFAFKNYDATAYNAGSGFNSRDPTFGTLNPLGTLAGPTRTFKFTVAASY
jgi:outer membrane receptor protein involved in Fe transport